MPYRFDIGQPHKRKEPFTCTMSAKELAPNLIRLTLISIAIDIGLYPIFVRLFWNNALVGHVLTLRPLGYSEAYALVAIIYFWACGKKYLGATVLFDMYKKLGRHSNEVLSEDAILESDGQLECRNIVDIRQCQV
jgi:hypothetical protein